MRVQSHRAHAGDSDPVHLSPYGPAARVKRRNEEAGCTTESDHNAPKPPGQRLHSGGGVHVHRHRSGETGFSTPRRATDPSGRDMGTQPALTVGPGRLDGPQQRHQGGASRLRLSTAAVRQACIFMLSSPRRAARSHGSWKGTSAPARRRPVWDSRSCHADTSRRRSARRSGTRATEPGSARVLSSPG